MDPVKKLQEILDKFNREFEAWREETGCEANFFWHYSPDKKIVGLASVAQFELQEVTKVLYSKDTFSSELVEKMRHEIDELAAKKTVEPC